MEASVGPQRVPSTPRRRRGVVYGLVGLASLLAFLAVFAIWANRQLLENDTWTETSTELLEDDEIRGQVAAFMVDALYANVDVAEQLKAGLPPRLQGLAAPASAGLRELTLRLANEALERPRVQALWKEANERTHQKLIDVVEHDADEDVNIDLGTITNELSAQTGIDLSSRLPADAASIEILKSDELSAAQTAVKALREVAIVLTLVALGIYGIAIYLARGWRREALRTIGFAFIGIGIVVLIARSLAGDLVVESLSSTEAVQPAISNTWEIGTSLLSAQGGAMIFYGLFIVIGAWLSGTTGFARSARRAITPVLERRAIAYSALALILLLLFVWSPTPGFERLPTALLLIALAIAGLEFLRHRAIEDFPNETWETGSARWSAGIRSRLGGTDEGGI